MGDQSQPLDPCLAVWSISGQSVVAIVWSNPNASCVGDDGHLGGRHSQVRTSSTAQQRAAARRGPDGGDRGSASAGAAAGAIAAVQDMEPIVIEVAVAVQLTPAAMAHLRLNILEVPRFQVERRLEHRLAVIAGTPGRRWRRVVSTAQEDRQQSADHLVLVPPVSSGALGHRQHSLAAMHPGQDFIDQVGRDLDHPPRGARWAPVVIANAPNPAGQALLSRSSFVGAVAPGGLPLVALPATDIAAPVFSLTRAAS